VFGLITGFMEAGESPETGICREVLEETGLQVKALRLLGSWEFLRMNQVLIAYHVRVAGNPDDVRLSPELLEYRWVTPEAARCWPAGTGYALAHWIRDKGVEPQFGAFRPGQSPEPDPAKGRCGHGAKMRGFSCRPPWRNGPPEPRCGFPFPSYPVLQRGRALRDGPCVSSSPPGVVVASTLRKTVLRRVTRGGRRYRCPSQGCCRLSTMAPPDSPQGRTLREPHAD
jgi:hypothetical protein